MLVQSLSVALTLSVLRGLIESGNLDEVASIEYAAKLIHDGLSPEVIQSTIDRTPGVAKPDSIKLQDMQGLRGRLLGSARKNIAKARKELIDKVPGGLFVPKESDMLYQWIADGKRYAAGSRPPAENFEKHPGNSRPWLTDRAAHCIRHIIFCYKMLVT